MTIVEIEAKKLVLENTKQSIVDKTNLELGPLQTQINQIVLRATEVLSRIDGQLLMLEEFRKEFIHEPTVETLGVTP